jgi:hypothetical protein
MVMNNGAVWPFFKVLAWHLPGMRKTTCTSVRFNHSWCGFGSGISLIRASVNDVYVLLQVAADGAAGLLETCKGFNSICFFTTY